MALKLYLFNYKLNYTTMNIGDKIYKIDCNGKYLRTINYVGESKVEWKHGYAMKSQIEINPNKKSKVKYIINYTK